MGLWEAVALWGPFSEMLMPSPVAVAQGLVELAAENELASHAAASLFRVAVGFGAAALLGVPAGLLLGWYGRARAAFDPLIQLLRPISPIAWIPLAILWFGIGSPSAVFIIFLTSLFPILITTAAAVREIDPAVLKVAANFGTPRPLLFRAVIFPACFPQIVVALRVSLGIAWVIIVAAEMVGMRSGLGFLILDSRNFLRTDLVVSTMVVIGLIGLTLDRTVRFLENGVRLRWGLEAPKPLGRAA